MHRIITIRIEGLPALTFDRKNRLIRLPLDGDGNHDDEGEDKGKPEKEEKAAKRTKKARRDDDDDDDDDEDGEVEDEEKDDEGDDEGDNEGDDDEDDEDIAEIKEKISEMMDDDTRLSTAIIAWERLTDIPASLPAPVVGPNDKFKCKVYDEMMELDYGEQDVDM